MKKVNLDEVHHVFVSHILEFHGLTKDEYGDYTKQELFDEILLTQEQHTEFEKNWLIPILDELESYRTKEWKKKD